MGRRAGASTATSESIRTVEDAVELIRAAGGRVTGVRRELLRLLFQADRMRSAEEFGDAIAKRLPDVAPSTVYRNLEELEQLGLVIHAHLGHGAAGYQLAWRASAYLHCERCGEILSVPTAYFDQLRDTAEAELGFVIDPSHFAVLGRCSACAALDLD